MNIKKNILFIATYITCTYTNIFAAATPVNPLDDVTTQMQTLSLFDRYQREGKTEVKAASPEKTQAILRNIARLIITDKTDSAILQINQLREQGISIDTQVYYPEEQPYNNWTLLFIATYKTNISALVAILAAGANPNQRLNNPLSLLHNFTALEFAIRSPIYCMQQAAYPRLDKLEEVVKTLLVHRADPNAYIAPHKTHCSEGESWTPLCMAIWYSRSPSMIKKLLLYGADPRRSVHGWTPLKWLETSKYSREEKATIQTQLQLLYFWELYKGKKTAQEILNES